MTMRKYSRVMPSDNEIDIVIPVVSKDLNILPLCIEGVRRQILHNISKIYIVAPNERLVRDFCISNNLEFVDELSVLGFSANDLNLIVNLPNGIQRNRSCWLFQQLIKLSGTVGTSRYYLCIDADHVLIHPHVFLSDDLKHVFYMSKEENKPYYESIHRLFPNMQLDNMSFVDHKMLFDRKLVACLHEEIERNCGKMWFKAILDSINREVISGFSEYELYGNYVKNRIQRPWFGKELSYCELADYNSLLRKYSATTWAITFPEWKKKNRV